ncbi:MAG: hypothetical protein AVDCRST_MAG71-3137 [uncultured Lysobacter sp.]|uniref:Uncharacterized protein n=1 Tax=uncultured Lysobacter sp. TaxID=271060 RepID=A0A6J4MF13_9GAMM|nr:MAG: hypothetical protein AVDCRST_MAG71-3137 [uncultured Lysobacter sp.]
MIDAGWRARRGVGGESASHSINVSGFNARVCRGRDADRENYRSSA